LRSMPEEKRTSSGNAGEGPSRGCRRKKVTPPAVPKKFNEEKGMTGWKNKETKETKKEVRGK